MSISILLTYFSSVCEKKNVDKRSCCQITNVLDQIKLFYRKNSSLLMQFALIITAALECTSMCVVTVQVI